jgi:hypothetical protein
MFIYPTLAELEPSGIVAIPSTRVDGVVAVVPIECGSAKSAR